MLWYDLKIEYPTVVGALNHLPINERTLVVAAGS
jgi:hypothetical protein